MTKSDPMTVYFKSLPILNSPSRKRGVASSTQPLNVNVGIAGVAAPTARRGASGRTHLVVRAALGIRCAVTPLGVGAAVAPLGVGAAVAPLGVGAAVVALSGCTRAEPPAPDATPWRAEPELVPPNAASLAPAPSSANAAAHAATPRTPAPSSANRPSDATPGTDAPAAPTSSAADPATLPQTHDVPAASGAAFDTRVRALWTAIVADDPEAAMPFFFPLGAYRQVKDVAAPEADWKHRLVLAYKRDIHALHARLGEGADHATLVSLDVPSAASRWVDPGEEWNKLGYYRVFGSKLRYSVDGRAGSFDVKSLISWRGEWYVVHLSAIR